MFYIFFVSRSEDENDMMKGASIIVASGANAIEFIQKFENDVCVCSVTIADIITMWCHRIIDVAFSSSFMSL